MKRQSEQEIRTRSIMPALRKAGWDLRQIREEYYFTDYPRAAAEGPAGRRHLMLAITHWTQWLNPVYH